MVYIEQCLYAALCFGSVVLILLECPTSSHADAGVIIASHLPKCKNLRKVKVGYMNPVPIMVPLGSCGNLDEVVITDPEHCTVGFPDYVYMSMFTTLWLCLCLHTCVLHTHTL